MYTLQIMLNADMFPLKATGTMKYCSIWKMLRNRKKKSAILALKFSCIFIQFKNLNFNFIHSFEKYIPYSFKHKISGSWGKKTENLNEK